MSVEGHQWWVNNSSWFWGQCWAYLPVSLPLGQHGVLPRWFIPQLWMHITGTRGHLGEVFTKSKHEDFIDCPDKQYHCVATTVCWCKSLSSQSVWNNIKRYQMNSDCRTAIIEVVRRVTLPFIPQLQFSAPAQTPKRIVSPTSIHPGRHIQPLGKYCSITKSLRTASLYKYQQYPETLQIGTHPRHPPSCYPACHHPKGVGMARSKLAQDWTPLANHKNSRNTSSGVS